MKALDQSKRPSRSLCTIACTVYLLGGCSSGPDVDVATSGAEHTDSEEVDSGGAGETSSAVAGNTGLDSTSPGDTGATSETQGRSENICDEHANDPLRRLIMRALGLGESDTLEPEAMSKLAQLSIDESGESEKMTSLSGIQCLTGLTHLSISGSDVRDLSPLSVLALKELYIGNSASPDFTTLTAAGVAASSLSTLKVSESAVQELTGVEKLSMLRILELRDNDIQDVSSLAGLEMLQELRLDGNRVRDIGPLTTLPTLQRLSVDENELTSLAALDAHPKLMSVTASGNRIASVSGLELPALVELDLSANALEEVGDVSGMPALLWLDTSSSQVTTVDGIESLQGIERLDLSGNPIVDVSQLAVLVSLQQLSLGDTGVDDLAPIAQLVALSSLDVWNTPATDLSPLLALTSLQSSMCSKLRVSQSQLDQNSLEVVIPRMCEGGWQVDGEAGEICRDVDCGGF